MGTYSFSIDFTLVTDHISKQRTLVPSVATAGGAVRGPAPPCRPPAPQQLRPQAGSYGQLRLPHSQQPGERRPPCPLYWGLILQRRTSPGTASHPPPGCSAPGGQQISSQATSLKVKRVNKLHRQSYQSKQVGLAESNLFSPWQS